MGEIKGKFVTDIFGVAAGVLQVLTSLWQVDLGGVPAAFLPGSELSGRRPVGGGAV